MGDHRPAVMRVGVVIAGLSLAAGGLNQVPSSAARADQTTDHKTASGPASAAPQPRTTPGARTLRIKVTPAPSRKARVEVRGPHGFRKVLRKSTTLKRLVPGRYRVAAAQVATTAWVAKPTVSKRRVRVTARKGGEVTVRYIAVSTQVEVVRPATVKAYEPSIDGTGMLTTTAELRPGEIVAAGVGAETPQGMLVRVTDIRRSGATSTYAVRQARLDEAIVQGEFEATITADLAPQARTAHHRGAQPRAATLCKVGGSGAEVGPSGGIDMKVSGSWGNGSPSLTMEVTPYAQLEAKSYIGAQMECAAEHTFFDRQFAPKTVMIGPVPLVIVPRLRLLGGVKVKTLAGMSVEGRARIDAKLTATASGSSLTTQTQGPTFTRSAKAEMGHDNVELDLYARARMTAEMYGVGGPYAQVQVGVKGMADKSEDPWWQVDAYGKAGVGVEIEKCAQVLYTKWCVSLTAGKDDLINHTLRIMDAGGPYPPTPTPTTTATPTPTPTPPAPPNSTTRLTVGPLSLDYSPTAWRDVYYGASGPGGDSFATDTTNSVGTSYPYLQVTDMTGVQCSTDLATCWSTVGSDTILGPAPPMSVGGRAPDSSARYLEWAGRDSLVWCFSAEQVCLSYRANSGSDPLQPSQALISMLAAGHWS